MTTQRDDLAAIRERLQSLERQNRRMKFAVLAIGSLVGSAALMAADPLRAKVLDTEKLVLRDKNGNIRCQIEVDGDNGVVQTLTDSRGRERLKLAASDDGVARFTMFDDKGATRIRLVTFPSDLKGAESLARISVLGLGSNGVPIDKGGICLQTSQDGTMEVFVLDKDKKERLSLRTLPDGLAAINVFDKQAEAKNSIQLGTLADGTAFQQFFGHKGSRQILLSTDAKGGATQFFFDDTAKARLNLGVAADGVAVQNLLDKDGTTRVRTIVVPKGTTNEGIGADGYAAQLFFDNKGNLRVDTSTYGDGQAGTDYRDPAGNRRLALTMFPNSESIIRHFDGKGLVRQYNGTYANGESGQAVLGKDGKTKFSTMVNQDDSLSYYQDKDAATKAWEATGNVLQLLDLGQRLGIIGGR